MNVGGEHEIVRKVIPDLGNDGVYIRGIADAGNNRTGVKDTIADFEDAGARSIAMEVEDTPVGTRNTGDIDIRGY